MGTSLISIVRISFHAAKTATATTMKFAIVLLGLLAVIGGSYSIPTENDGSAIEPALNAAADVNGPPEAKSDNAGDDADADDDDEDGEDEDGDDDDDDDHDDDDDDDDEDEEDDDEEDEEDDAADDDGTEEG